MIGRAEKGARRGMPPPGCALDRETLPLLSEMLQLQKGERKRQLVRVEKRHTELLPRTLKRFSGSAGFSSSLSSKSPTKSESFQLPCCHLSLRSSASEMSDVLQTGSTNFYQCNKLEEFEVSAVHDACTASCLVQLRICVVRSEHKVQCI